jgi:DNA-binding NtrC family response regulator
VGDGSVIAQAYLDGVYDHLVKRFTAEWLIAAVRRPLEYRRLKLENRANQAELAKCATASSAGQGESPMRKRVLIVDDDDNTVTLFSSVGTSVGYQCTTVTGAIEVLAILDSIEEFEIVVSGLIMPDGEAMLLLEGTRERLHKCPL